MIPLLLCAALAGTPPTAAQAEKLAALIAKKDWSAAAAAARALERAVAETAPLEIVDLQPLDAPPDGLGMYTELFKHELRKDELYVYAQVRNHGLRHRAGFYELHLVSDIVLKDAEGQELARDEGFGESRFTARAEHRDTFVVIAMATKGLPAGTYRLELVLHDRIAGQDAKAATTFEIP